MKHSTKEKKEEFVSDKEIEKRKPLVNAIMRQVKLSSISHKKIYRSGDIFFSLIGLSSTELTRVAKELNINTNEL